MEFARVEMEIDIGWRREGVGDNLILRSLCGEQGFA